MVRVEGVSLLPPAMGGGSRTARDMGPSPSGLLLQGFVGALPLLFPCVLQVPYMLFQASDSGTDNGGFSAVFHQGCQDTVITFALLPPTLYSSPFVTGMSEAAMVL